MFFLHTPIWDDVKLPINGWVTRMVAMYRNVLGWYHSVRHHSMEKLGPWKGIQRPSGYVKIAIENDHRNSGFSH